MFVKANNWKREIQTYIYGKRTVDFDIKTKVMQEKVLNEAGTQYQIIDTNDRKIDRSLISLLEKTEGTKDINYISNKYALGTEYIVTWDEYEMITEATTLNSPIPMFIPLF